jgi:hypothetical protein
MTSVAKFGEAVRHGSSMLWELNTREPDHPDEEHSTFTALGELCKVALSPLARLEHALHPYVRS